MLANFWDTRMPRPRSALAAAAVAALCTLTSTIARAERITFGDWVLECKPVGEAASAHRACQLRQSLTDQKARRLLEIVALKRGATATLEVVAPLGLSILYGIRLQIDGLSVPQPMQLVSCEPDGCRALLPLTGPLILKLKATKRVSVSFQDAKSGKTAAIEGSVNGLAQGLAMVAAAE